MAYCVSLSTNEASASARALIQEPARNNYGRRLLQSSDMGKRFTDDLGRSISSLILSVLFGSVAAASGIGGGPFYVPLFTYDLGFGVKGAAALSQVLVAAGSLSAVVYLLNKKNPCHPDRPLIDYEAAVLMLPALLLGVLLGVLGNRTLPAWLVTMLLLVILVLLTVKMYLKALQLHAHEQCQHKGSSANSEQGQEVLPESVTPNEEDQHHSEFPDLNFQSASRSRVVEAKGAMPDPSNVVVGEVGRSRTPATRPADVQASTMSKQQRELRHKSTRGESRRAEANPAANQVKTMALKTLAFLLLLFWAVFLLLQVLLAKWSSCSPAHWLIYAVLVAACLAFQALYIFLVRRARLQQKSRDAERPVAGVQSTYSLCALTRMSAVTLVCGFVAGLFGIGGGIVLGPLLLSMGFTPRVAAATANLMVFLSSSSAAAVYGLSGLLNREEAIVVWTCTFPRPGPGFGPSQLLQPAAPWE
ncbi:g1092 [Coccomyxa elongata]